MHKFTSEDLKKMIRHRHRNAVLIEELRIGCGFTGGAERSIDVWAIESNASKGCTAVSYEVKISRADFQRDMKNPLKQRGARLFSDQFYFVTPPGMLKRDEIPDWAGLIEPNPESLAYWDRYPGCKTIVPAPFRSKDAPSWPLVVSMLRRTPIVVGQPEAPSISINVSPDRLTDDVMNLMREIAGNQNVARGAVAI